MSDPRCWKNTLIPAETRVQIADGEIERLRVCLSKANEQAEHFEREWYLRGDELEQLRAELAACRAAGEAAGYARGLADERERICAAIKAEDDYCVTEGDYMLDSDDCIRVARGTWERPDYALRGEVKP